MTLFLKLLEQKITLNTCMEQELAAKEACKLVLTQKEQQLQQLLVG